MSVFAHPDAAGYGDIFDFDDNTLHIAFRSESTYHGYDAICMIIMHAVRALKAAVAQLKLQIDIEELHALEKAPFQFHFKN